MTAIDTPDGIEFFSLLQHKHGLGLELKGIRFKKSVYAQAKRRYNLTGDRQSVYDQLDKMVEDALARR